MLHDILVGGACAIVAWNFPQPQWAKNVQARVLGWFKSVPSL